ncbi:related to reverse transcriptase [Sporisorium scitamineum]|uniref:Related to reverse transcriptase n=1 Tax=Sporisorium scitamineum TaxID=49012 RepID=A0A127ZG06_9BASI|nr:related to reverse transcriptase [Sporisorium scitamineum]
MTETSLCRLNILTRYDHYPLLISTSEETELEAPPGPWSCQNVNWESFPYMLYLETTSQAAHADPTAEWAHLLEALKNAVARSQKAREGGRPRKRVHRNRWWNKECVEAAEAKLAAFEVALERNQHVAQDSRRAVAHQDDEYKKACRRLTHTNKKAKRKAVTDAVGELNSAREWQVMAVIRKKTKSPNILSPPFWLAGRVSATGAADKAKLLLSTIFPSAVQVEGSERSGMQLDVEEGTNEVGDVGVPRDGTIARLDYDERGSTEPMEETDEVPPILPHVKESELDGAIKGLKSGKAAGRDGLGPGLLKKAYHLSPVFKTRLLRLVDICVTEARFPEQWKVAAVTIIPKAAPRDYSQPKSYRPISLLSVAGKLVDSIFAQRLQHEIGRMGLLRQQYGNITGIPTVQEAAHLMEIGKREMEDGRHVSVLTIDVGSAFNRVQHDRLQYDLQRLGLQGIANWVRGWLQGRTFHLVFEGHTTDEYRLQSLGVPQGSPLSPLLWSIYADSLFVVSRTAPSGGGSDAVFQGAYVDDIVAMFAASESKEVVRQTQRWLDRLASWSNERSLLLDKPTFLLTKKGPRPDPESRQVTLPSGERLSPTPSTIKILGVIIGHRFSLHEFVLRKCHIARYTISTLRCFPSMPGSPVHRLKLLRAAIFSALDYRAELHPLIPEVLRKEVRLVDHAAYAFVLGVSLDLRYRPSALSLTHELGQYSTYTRWHQMALKLGIRLLSNQQNLCNEYAVEVKGRLPSWSKEDRERNEVSIARPRGLLTNLGTDKMLIVGRDGVEVEGMSRLKHRLWRTGPITLILQSLPFQNFEQVSVPETVPWEWEGLDITIGSAEQAHSTVECLVHSRQEHRASIFVDGAKGAASEDAGGLGAAAVGFSNSSPARKWTVKERLDGSIWTVVEAELYAILIGLRSCLGGFWKRIDILSDSQVALHRLSAGYTNDRTKPGQFLVRQVRRCIGELRAQRYVMIKFWWIPGHQDIELHDEADAAAKLAARMPMPLSIDDPALRVVREQVSINKVREWTAAQMLVFEQTLFDLGTHNSLKEVSPTFEPRTALQRYINLGWRTKYVLVLFQVNTLMVATHRNPLAGGCLCGAEEQSREHLLFDCVLLEDERSQLQAHLPLIASRSLRHVLEDGKFNGQRGTDTRGQSQGTGEEGMEDLREYLADLRTLLEGARRIIFATCRSYGLMEEEEEFHYIPPEATFAHREESEERHIGRGNNPRRLVSSSRRGRGLRSITRLRVIGGFGNHGRKHPYAYRFSNGNRSFAFVG